MTDQATSTSTAPTPKLSEEPGFVVVDISGPFPIGVRAKGAGLLAFLYIEPSRESVIKILMCDDLANAYSSNLPFSGRANRAAYFVFPPAHGLTDKVRALAARLKLYTQLTERYNAPQRDLRPSDVTIRRD